MLISEFEWDEANMEHLAQRAISPSDCNAMLRQRITVRRNRRAGSGQYKFIGKTVGGRTVTLIVATTAVAGRYRPVTGWDATDGERSDYGA